LASTPKRSTSRAAAKSKRTPAAKAGRKAGATATRRSKAVGATSTSQAETKSTAVLHLSRAMREITGIAAVATALIMLLALATFNINDPGWSHTGTGVRIENSIGRAGAWFADVFYYLFGYMAYLLPIMLGFYGWTLFRDRHISEADYRPFVFVRILGFVIMLLAASGLADLHFSVPQGALPHNTFGGGILGTTVAWKLVAMLKPLGTTLVLLAVFFSSLTLAIGTSWIHLIEAMGALVLAMTAKVTRYFHQYQESREEDYKRREAAKARERQREQLQPAVAATPPRKPRKPLFSKKEATDADEAAIADDDPALDSTLLLASLKDVTRAAIADARDKPAPQPKPAIPVLKKKKSGSKTAKAGDAKTGGGEKQFPLFTDIPDSDLPPLALLDPPEVQQSGFSEAELEAMSRLLEVKLADFNIVAEVVDVQPGPVITRFEIQPSPGVKARQITNLTQDIARSLSIVSVRVVEVIAGRSTIGLEIPNEAREIVQLSEMLQSEQYEKEPSPLTLALGKNISGVPVTADLARMPHLLVAGTTGSGKSVAVNSMLISLLYKATPREVRLILIDPKMLELNVYDGIPHLLTPVVTDMKEAANLWWSSMSLLT